MDKSPALWKFGWKFLREGGKEKGKGEGKKRRKGKREARRKGKWKRREIVEGRRKTKNGRGIGMKMSRGSFFFLEIFFETTEIFLGCTKIKISTGKKSIARREKIRKCDFAPLKKYSSYAIVCIYYGGNFLTSPRCPPLTVHLVTPLVTVPLTKNKHVLCLISNLSTLFFENIRYASKLK